MVAEPAHATDTGFFAIRLAMLNELALELSKSSGEDELCRRAVELGAARLGFDRVGLWLRSCEDPDLLEGTYGTDESGAIRTERGRRHRREVWPGPDSEGRDCPLRFQQGAVCHDDQQRPVGRADRAAALLWDGLRAWGELTVDNLLSGKPIAGGELELLVLYARTVGHLLRRARDEGELRLQATTDILTGVMNRRVSLLFLEKQMGMALRKGQPLSAAYVDLDGLKAVNDGFGHAEGDEYIASVAAVLLSAVRGSDSVGRLGGDEFLVVFPDCPGANAESIMRRITRQAAERGAEAGKGYPFSLSWGVACVDELGAQGMRADVESLVELADRRMYEDKTSRKAGRI